MQQKIKPQRLPQVIFVRDTNYGENNDYKIIAYDNCTLEDTETSYTRTDIHLATKAELEATAQTLANLSVKTSEIILKQQSELERVKQSHTELLSLVRDTSNIDLYVYEQKIKQAITNAEKALNND